VWVSDTIEGDIVAKNRSQEFPMIRTSMTWQAARQRWRKWYRKVLYQVSCDELGCARTKADSYQAANAWWLAKRAEIDSQQRPGRFSYEIKTLEQRRDWYRAHGMSDHARGLTEWIKDLESGMEDLHPSIVSHLVHPGDASDAVWHDRLSRERSSVPEERLMGKQIDRYLDLQSARAGAAQISVSEADQIRMCLMAFQNWVGSESLIDSVTPDRWESWYLHLLHADISIEYKKKQFRHARNFLMWMAEKGLLTPPLNLHARRYRFVGGHKIVETIPVHEVRAILDRANEVLRLHLLLFLNCGMTQVDVSDLHPSEVNWEAGRITRRRSKTEKKRTTPIVSYELWAETWALLKKFGHREGHHVLLTRTCRPWVRDEIVNRRRKRTDGIKSLYAHLKVRHPLKQFRKTGATVLDRRFPESVELYLGHAPRTITEKSYVPPDRDRFDEAIRWLGEQFASGGHAHGKQTTGDV
jgi:integrase